MDQEEEIEVGEEIAINSVFHMEGRRIIVSLDWLMIEGHNDAPLGGNILLRIKPEVATRVFP